MKLYYKLLCFLNLHKYVPIIKYYNNKKTKEFYCAHCNKKIIID